MKRANSLEIALAGGRFGVVASIVPGRRLGSKIGFPTLNSHFPRTALISDLPRGCYRVLVRFVSGRLYSGLACVFDSETREASSLLETNLGSEFDPSTENQTAPIWTIFLGFYRDFEKMSTPDAIAGQIARDWREQKTTLAAEERAFRSREGESNPLLLFFTARNRFFEIQTILRGGLLEKSESPRSLPLESVFWKKHC